MNTRGFTPVERELAIRRLLADNVTARTEDEAPMAHLEAVRRSLTDWRVWMLAIGYVVSIETGCNYWPEANNSQPVSGRIRNNVIFLPDSGSGLGIHFAYGSV